MVLTILVLLALILITPSLLGRSPELVSLPILVIGLSRDNATLAVNVGGAVGWYMYENATLHVRALNPGSTYNVTTTENETYEIHQKVPVNVTSSFFRVHTLVFDPQGNYFETNVTARVYRNDEGRIVMAFTFPDPVDTNLSETLRFPPEDFRWVIPLRGRL